MTLKRIKDAVHVGVCISNTFLTQFFYITGVMNLQFKECSHRALAVLQPQKLQNCILE